MSAVEAEPRRLGLLIGGREDSDSSRETFRVVAPADGRVLAEVEEASAADVDRAVAGARAAFEAQRADSGAERADRLRAAGAALAGEAEEVVELMIESIGKPRRFAAFEAGRGFGLLTACAEELPRLRGESLPLDATAGGEGHWGITRREPFGVVAAITPWNAPINLVLQKVAPALAMGNAVVIKPAPEAALVGMWLAERLAPHFPEGMVNLVQGGPPVVTALVSHEDVRAVSLTGGTVAGEAVARAAGAKPVMLELGSNSPNLVLADADIEDAAPRIAEAAFGASGQQCISAQRIIVERAVYDAFAERFVAASSELSVGDPADASVLVGPVVSERARDRIVAMIDDAEALGAGVLLDGRSDGTLLGPTVLADVPRGARILREEVFGPVAALIAVDSAQEAVQEANAVDGILQAACFTTSVAAAMDAAEGIRAGTVLINDPTRFRLDVYPFGGVGRSGVGREGVRYAMEALSQLKFVALRRA